MLVDQAGLLTCATVVDASEKDVDRWAWAQVSVGLRVQQWVQGAQGFVAGVRGGRGGSREGGWSGWVCAGQGLNHFVGRGWGEWIC